MVILKRCKGKKVNIIYKILLSEEKLLTEMQKIVAERDALREGKLEEYKKGSVESKKEMKATPKKTVIPTVPGRISKIIINYLHRYPCRHNEKDERKNGNYEKK